MSKPPYPGIAHGRKNTITAIFEGIKEDIFQKIQKEKILEKY